MNRQYVLVISRELDRFHVPERVQQSVDYVGLYVVPGYGYVVPRAIPGEWQAFTRDAEFVGMYPTRDAAADALILG